MSENEKIDIKGLNKAQLLAAFYNDASPQGLGFTVATDGNMTVTQASNIIKRNKSLHFDYVGGRSLKIRLEGDSFDPWLYDRDNGKGAAARIIEAVRASPAPEEQPPVPFLQRLATKLHLRA